jgi:hypothetical protein
MHNITSINVGVQNSGWRAGGISHCGVGSVDGDMASVDLVVQEAGDFGYIRLRREYSDPNFIQH